MSSTHYFYAVVFLSYFTISVIVAVLVGMHPHLCAGQVRVVSMLSKKMALRTAAPIKDNMALVIAAKEETAKANRKKMQLPTRLVFVDLCL